FELRLNNLQAAPAAFLLFNFSIQGDQLTGPELVFQVSTMEPSAFQGVTFLACGHVKDIQTGAGAKQTRSTDFRNHARHLTRAKLRYATGIHPVFIAERQVIQEVFDRSNPFGSQNIPEMRADALDELNRGVEFQHVRMISMLAGQAGRFSNG